VAIEKLKVQLATKAKTDIKLMLNVAHNYKHIIIRGFVERSI